VKPSTPDAAGEKLIERNRLRLLATEAIKKSMVLAGAGKTKEAVDVVKEVSKEIMASSVKNEAAIKDLKTDVDGQMSEAVSREDWYKKWGRHYLPSLLGAHLSQQCNNFKDPGVQHYVSKLFKSLRDDLDAIFLKLPAPKPSAPISKYSASSSGGSVSRAPVNMSSYYSSGNPCFDGSCLVAMADGSEKRVKDLRKGDELKSTSSALATIACVVKTITATGRTQLVKLDGGLAVTPYHPLRVNGVWVFPCDLAESYESDCEAVYSFVLEKKNDVEPVMLINGYECVTLAHGLSASKVVAHPFFGTESVLESLQAMNGWAQGRVVLQEGCVVRDSETGLVTGLRQESS